MGTSSSDEGAKIRCLGNYICHISEEIVFQLPTGSKHVPTGGYISFHCIVII